MRKHAISLILTLCCSPLAAQRLIKATEQAGVSVTLLASALQAVAAPAPNYAAEFQRMANELKLVATEAAFEESFDFSISPAVVPGREHVASAQFKGQCYAPKVGVLRCRLAGA